MAANQMGTTQSDGQTHSAADVTHKTGIYEQTRRAVGTVYNKTSGALGTAYDKTSGALSGTYTHAAKFGRQNPGKVSLITFGAGVGVGLLLAKALTPRRRGWFDWL